ncbi:ABC transporter substrate-binding protein [Mobilicoccus caccae]|uniref:ABC transporter substrate-binding protein n=1 Tax=Mobilicoccus caccae TaxID=1859295 RepID=A0ABQ6IXJ1_9MICO|nr:ABC transporter substrate-binding protein [Mobilicoccus caccae]GMA42028.1 ABC transporter substrate-binding protein [Mobilicoccus caccae]
MTTRTLRATALLTGGLLLLVGCGQAVTGAPAATTPQATASVTNCGTPVTYAGAPQRIVALNPGQADLIARLGAADRIVGVAQTHGRPLPETLTGGGRQIPVVGQDSPPTREQLLTLQPDLVVSPTTYEFTAEKGYATQDQLRKAGAATYVAAAGCLDRRSEAEVSDLITDIDSLGQVLGADDAARRLTAEANAQLQKATDRAKDKPKPTLAQVFIEGETVTAIGAGVEHSIGEAAGGRGVFSPDDPAFAKFFAAEVSRETLLAKNPDVIVFSALDDEHEKRTRQWLSTHLGSAKAVQQGRLVAIPASQLLPGTWGNLDAVTTINEALYPSE